MVQAGGLAAALLFISEAKDKWGRNVSLNHKTFRQRHGKFLLKKKMAQNESATAYPNSPGMSAKGQNYRWGRLIHNGAVGAILTSPRPSQLGPRTPPLSLSVPLSRAG